MSQTENNKKQQVAVTHIEGSMKNSPLVRQNSKRALDKSPSSSMSILKMARKRIRKSDKGSFTDEQMRKAVEEVLKNNTTLRNAAEMYNVKYQTLARYVTKQKQNEGQNILEKNRKKQAWNGCMVFLKRHSNVSIRRPENCSLSRVTAFNFQSNVFSKI
ncbi:hypothetical protein NQ315_015329 [Exocentrus adspersus]|uniref:HTH psq-type domain-containing protein n=1 Tax=Exocentrus adspersus TaxID=1586481 RepID=A0AAV8V6J4_9CUCU|nr:hypothetical protein NQ315_015329 [Exocentrus adspersus]